MVNEIPDFPFEVPEGYRWLVDTHLIGFEPNSPLQPWHYLPRRHAFDLSERWPSGPARKCLFAFAKRQDCDDLACFEVVEGKAGRVLVVHGWTSAGYEIVGTYESFWDWLKSVIDDIAEWIHEY